MWGYDKRGQEASRLQTVRVAARGRARLGRFGSFGPDLRPGRFFQGDGAGRRAWTFVVGVVVPFALLLFADTSATDPRVLVAAGVAAVLIVVALAGLPWSRLPAWTQAAPVFAYFVVIGILRDAG